MDTARTRSARHGWLLWFLLLNVLLAGVSLATDPIVREAAFDRLPPGATVDDKAVLGTMLDQELVLRVAFLPVRTFVGWGLFALCLYYMAVAFRPPAPVRLAQMFALEVRSESALVLGAVVGAVRQGLAPARFSGAPPWSILELTGTGGGLGTDALLGALNPFALLYLALLISGVGLVCGFGRVRSALVVLGVWVTTTVLNAGALVALRDLLQLGV
jgi:hypothetical protein